MLRLPKRHKRDADTPPPAVEATRLLAEQRFGNGVMVAAVAAVVSIAAYVWVAMLFDRNFPWFSVLQGIAIGIAMRRAGLGIDWRFPAAAAGITAIAAAAGSFVVALFLTGREFGTGPFVLISEISVHTVQVFFSRNFGVADVIYMVFASVLAVFYSHRRLQRHEAIALRRWRERDAAADR